MWQHLKQLFGQSVGLTIIVWVLLFVLIVGPMIGFGIYHFFVEQPEHHVTAVPPSESYRSVRLSPDAKKGKLIYDRACQSCHGRYGTGSTKGPALLAYLARHHSNQTFYDAVRNGVKQHHWSFGDMPAIPGVKRDDVTNIIKFIRELQKHKQRPDQDDQ